MGASSSGRAVSGARCRDGDFVRPARVVEMFLEQQREEATKLA
jgi:hypothetical protein